MESIVAASHAPTRAQWLDGAKGLGILLVVYGHASRALYGQLTAPAWARTVDHLIYTFHMPLFFLISGLFVWSSIGKGRKKFAIEKIETIIYPYILWSVIEGGLEIAFSKEVNSPVYLRDLVMIPIVPIEQFWFLYAMALCLMLGLACYPYKMAVAAAALTGILVVARWGAADMILRSLAFFPYVAAGILFSANIRALGKSRTRASVVLAGTVAVFACGILARWDGVVGSLLVALAGSGATLAFAVMIGTGTIGTVLALLGRASLAIYVMHTIFSAGLRIVVKAASVSVPDPITLLMTTVVGIAGPLCVWLVAERWGFLMPLGLGRTIRQARVRTH